MISVEVLHCLIAISDEAAILELQSLSHTKKISKRSWTEPESTVSSSVEDVLLFCDVKGTRFMPSFLFVCKTSLLVEGIAFVRSDVCVK